LTALAVATSLAACDHSKPKEDPTLTKIKQESSCGALQTTLDKAERDSARDYYDAAFKRMRELRCFDSPITPASS
jgi:hypothetical protein